MQTSTNQILKPVHAEQEQPKEQRLNTSKFTEYTFVIELIDEREVLIEASLKNISKYGANIQVPGAIKGFFAGATISASLRLGNLPISENLRGILVWERVEENSVFYGIQFNSAIEINIINAITENTAEINNILNNFPRRFVPNINVLGFVFEIESFFDQVSILLKDLDAKINTYKYESAENLEAHLIVYFSKKFAPGLNDLVQKANHLYDTIPEEQRKENFSYIREHLRKYLILDPFLWRTIEKPLGYAGDYMMMQSLYREKIEGANLLGKIIHNWVIHIDSGTAVRNRKDYFFTLIKNLLDYSEEKKTILSIASGPAQEIVSLIENADQETLDRAEILLLDQDALAITEARHSIRVALLRTQKRLNVDFLHLELSKFLAKPGRYLKNNSIDLIYSAGLFDYIGQRTARKICAKLFQLLSPNAELYLGNFTDKSPEKGFLEILDWQLIYRADTELLDFAAEIQGNIKVDVINGYFPQRYFYLKNQEQSFGC